MTTFAEIAEEARSRVLYPPRVARPDDIVVLFRLLAGLAGIVDVQRERITALEQGAEGGEARRKRSR